MQNVKRVILSGNWTEINFTQKAKSYFVKNYSDGDMYVSFEENDNENSSFKIKSGVAEEVAINQSAIHIESEKTETIYIKGTGEVEVQQM